MWEEDFRGTLFWELGENVTDSVVEWQGVREFTFAESEVSLKLIYLYVYKVFGGKTSNSGGCY